MHKKIKEYAILYYCIFLTLFWPSKAKKPIQDTGNAPDPDWLIKTFRKNYWEAILVTLFALLFGYIFAGLPCHLPWAKLIPTLLIAFPVYGSRNLNTQTIGGEGTSDKMDTLFFKTIYLIGVTWLSWDIFKGII